MYREGGCKITRHMNGFEVSLKDPEIVKANEKRDRLKYDDPKRGSYRDPNQTFVFKTDKEVIAFLTTNLSKMIPEADFDTSFDIAAAETIDD